MHSHQKWPPPLLGGEHRNYCNFHHASNALPDISLVKIVEVDVVLEKYGYQVLIWSMERHIVDLKPIRTV
jgi:hypothetical protein